MAACSSININISTPAAGFMHEAQVAGAAPVHSAPSSDITLKSYSLPPLNALRMLRPSWPTLIRDKQTG